MSLLFARAKSYTWRSYSGFTLFELLGALAIIGILLGTITFSYTSHRSRTESDAERFLALITLASDQAILQSKSFCVQFGLNNYSFYEVKKGVWVPSKIETFRKRYLSQRVKMRLTIDGVEQGLEAESDPFKKDRPTIFLLSSGDISAFILTFQSIENQDTIHIAYDPMKGIIRD